MTLKVVAVLFAKVREEMFTSAAKGGRDSLHQCAKLQRLNTKIPSVTGLYNFILNATYT